MSRVPTFVLAVAALAAAALAPAQYTAGQTRSSVFGAVKLKSSSGEIVSVAEGTDKYVDDKTGQPLDPNSNVQDGTKVRNVRTGEVYVVQVPERFISLGIHFASFGVAGPIQQADGSFVGGTSNANNPLFSIDAGLPIPRRYGKVGLGGWYFFSPRGKINDVYQIHLRYGGRNNSPYGFQVAYLNARRPESQGVTFHATYTLSSARIAPTSPPWSVEFGLGLFNDFSRQPLVGGTYRTRNSLEPSVYVNTNWTIAPKVSMVATLWSLRDRNIDLTRYGVGIAYRF